MRFSFVVKVFVTVIVYHVLNFIYFYVSLHSIFLSSKEFLDGKSPLTSFPSFVNSIFVYKSYAVKFEQIRMLTLQIEKM